MSFPPPTPQHAVPPNFSSAEFRLALGMFATGVTIITTRDEAGGFFGMTASSFNSVSLSPPLVLWSLDLGSPSLALFENATHYAVNVLAADQRQLAERFAKKGIDRFEGTPWRPGLTGAPVIDGAVAVFECTHRSQYDEGDHVIFVGQVEHCRRRIGAAPLVFHGGRFFTDLPI